MSGLVVGRVEVGIGALRVASRADHGGAAAAGLAGLDGEAVLGEFGVGANVDARHVPEDGGVGDSVLVLEDIGLVGLGGQLNRNTTAAGRRLPVLRVGAAAGGEGLHVSSIAADRPEVDVLVKVVLDGHAAAARRAAAAGGRGGRGRGGRAIARGVGKRGSQGSEGGRKAESLGEHHFEV